MQATVVREGTVQDISIFDLVVGDILVFETGDILQADAIMITGTNVRCTSALNLLPFAASFTFPACTGSCKKQQESEGINNCHLSTNCRQHQTVSPQPSAKIRLHIFPYIGLPTASHMDP